MNEARAEHPDRPIELVVFDLGQVLIRVCNGWEDACARLGIQIAPRRSDSETQKKIADAVHRIDSGLCDVESFAREVAPLRGIGVDDVLRVHEAYLLGCFEGAADLLDEIIKTGARTACLSNTNARHWEMMVRKGGRNSVPFDRLHHHFASHLIGFCKPDGRAYEHVERETKVRPERIAFFDDRSENVKAAISRGWRAREIELDGDPISQMRRHLAALGLPIRRVEVK